MTKFLLFLDIYKFLLLFHLFLYWRSNYDLNKAKKDSINSEIETNFNNTLKNIQENVNIL